MSERATPLQKAAVEPDVSLVAHKKPPPETLVTAATAISRPAKPIAPKSIASFVDEKAKEAEAIEREKKKSAMQKVGAKVKKKYFSAFHFFLL